MQLTALEGVREITRAVTRLTEAFPLLEKGFGSPPGSESPEVLLSFCELQAGPPAHYFIGFSRPPHSWRACIVQTSMVAKGINRHYASVVAADDRGHRWLMHDGRLKLKSGLLKMEEMEVAGLRARDTVGFSDKKKRLYYPVADLDRSPEEVARSIGEYVRICERMRRFRTGEVGDADDLRDPNELDLFEDIEVEGEDQDESSGGGHRAGPPPRKRLGNRPPNENQSVLPAQCYVFRFDGTNTWKIGWALDARKRLRRVQVHVPIHLKRPDGRAATWRRYAAVDFQTAGLAYEWEQHVLTVLLAHRVPVREQVDCSPKLIDKILGIVRDAAARNVSPPHTGQVDDEEPAPLNHQKAELEELLERLHQEAEIISALRGTFEALNRRAGDFPRSPGLRTLQLMLVTLHMEIALSLGRLWEKDDERSYSMRRAKRLLRQPEVSAELIREALESRRLIRDRQSDRAAVEPEELPAEVVDRQTKSLNAAIGAIVSRVDQLAGDAAQVHIAELRNTQLAHAAVISSAGATRKAAGQTVRTPKLEEVMRLAEATVVLIGDIQGLVLGLLQDYDESLRIHHDDAADFLARNVPQEDEE